MATHAPPQLLRLAAFTAAGAGGNPAGVWLGDTLPTPDEMQRIAAEVGYSETAFVAAPDADGIRPTRYFSPRMEIPFCGHATIAAGVALAGRFGLGEFRLGTSVGEVPVRAVSGDAGIEAVLVSVEPRLRPADPALLSRTLELLGWSADDLDPALPPAKAYAGAWHLVLAARTAARLDVLAYDFEALRALMLAHDLITLQLVHRVTPTEFLSRNPFPTGGVVEDPATGAAAAALGGYLRAHELVDPPATLLIRQGEAMGRPSRLRVRVPVEGGIEVAGAAAEIG